MSGENHEPSAGIARRLSTASAQAFDERHDRGLALRIGALGLVVLATVLVPYLLIRDWSRKALEAEAWVQHTEEVSDTTSQLMFHLRDMVAAAYGRLAGVQAPMLQERYATARARIDPLVGELERMTQDNPDQLVRVGQIKALLEQRLPYLDTAVGDTDPTTRAELLDEMERMLGEGSIGDIANELARAEDQLLAGRTQRAAQLRADVEWLQTVSLFVQVLLLGGIAFLSEREARARRHAEHRSSEADLRNRAIFHTVHEPIALLDRDLNILTRNTAFAELYGGVDSGAPPQPLGGSSAGAWDDATLQQRLGDVVSRNREIWDYEHSQRTLDGVRRHVMVNARQIVLPNQTDRAVLLTVSDVTPLKISEAHVRDLNRQLEDKVEQVSDANRELEAFSYSVSHDLRAPLRHIAGFAEKLRRHIDPEHVADEKTRHYLDVIGNSAARMAVLIDDLLLHSRLGRGAMRQQRVDFDTLVADVRDMLTSQRKQEIEWRIAPLPVVPGDETMLRQVWQNLLSNAIKYSGTQEHAVIEVQHRVEGEMHAFCVRDNGVGFDMQYAGKLFGVFQRLHKASEFPGSGIGLANVRRIVTRHGGRVWADAEMGKGAAFHFTLPVRQDAPADSEQASENPR